VRPAGVIVAVAVLLGMIAGYGAGAPQACRSGDAQGFAAIRDDPPNVAGNIPNRFTRDPQYFSRRYNCTGGHVYARRLDLGVYEVRFPGLPGRAPVVSALSQEGVTASVFVFDDVYRIALRGPLAGEDIARRRDVPFAIAIH
jgi:hypothetical protein